MNMYHTYLICFISSMGSLLLANTPIVAQGVLKGRGKPNTKWFINAPLEGRHFETAGFKPIVDESGNFSTQIKSTRPGFLYTFVGNKVFILWYTPGQKSLVDLSNIKQPIFSGTNAERNRFLFSMSELSNYFSSGGAHYAGLVPEAVYDSLRRKFDEDIRLIYQYNKSNQNEETFCRAVSYERCYRFIDFFTQLAIRNAPPAFFQISGAEQSEEQRQEVMTFIKKWSNAWERVYNDIYNSPLLQELNGNLTYDKPIDFLVGSEPPCYSQSFTQFLNNYYNWFLGDFQQRDQDLSLTAPSTYYKIVASRSAMMVPALREIYIANKLEFAPYRGAAYQTSDYLDLYKLLKREFPQSVYLPYLESPVKKIEEYIAKSADKSAGIKIYKTSDIQSIDELLSKHKRGVTYVDLWATWCGPCIEKFSYADKLSTFARECKIDLVYISIDELKNEKTFREVIFRHNLAGYHIRASEALTKDVWLQIASPETITGEIPRYLIVKDGVIVDYKAPHPGEYDKLVAQLTTYLK